MPVRARLARLLLPVLLPVLQLIGSAAFAAPQFDPVLRLLSDKGSLEVSAEAGFVQQMRDRASDMVLSAMNFLGVRYRRGGNTAESGFDCSGFTRHVFEGSLGLVLPRRVDEQASAPGLVGVKRDELKPGDLVFFNTLKRTFSHVGIYIGDNKFIHSPRVGGEVRIEDMRLAYWTRRFTGARRAEPLQHPASLASLAPADPASVLPLAPLTTLPAAATVAAPAPAGTDSEGFRVGF